MLYLTLSTWPRSNRQRQTTDTGIVAHDSPSIRQAHAPFWSTIVTEREDKRSNEKVY